MANQEYHVKAILEAKDSSFSSTFNRALESVRGLSKSQKSFGSGLKAMVAGSAVFGVVQRGMSAVSSSLDGAISRFDTLNNYPIMMQNLGYSADDATASIQKMSDGIDGLPTALDDIAGSVTKIAPLTGSLDKATDITLAMNNALLAGGKSMDVQTNALEQYSQMLSYGKVDMQSWKSMMNAMPGQLNQLSQKLLGAGKNGMDLYDAMKKGTISFDQFNNALLDLNENGMEGFASFQDQAVSATQGIGTAVKNIKTAVTKGLTDTLQTISDTMKKNGFGTIADNLNKVKGGIKSGFKFINKNIATLLNVGIPALKEFGKKMSPVMNTVRRELSLTGKSFGRFKGAIGSAFKDAFKGADIAGFVETLQKGVRGIGKALRAIMDFASKHADAIVKVASWIPKLALGLFAFKKVKGIASPIIAFAKAFKKMKGGADAAKSLGGASQNMKKMAQASTTFVKTAVGILLVATAFSMLAQAAVAVSSTKGATGVLIGLGVALGVVAFAMNKMVEGLGYFQPKKIDAIGNTFLKMGAGVFLVAAGFALLAGAAAFLASQGGLAIGVFVGMAVVIGGLLAVVSVLGAGLTAAAGGLVAFGVAMLLAGAGALLASAGLYIVAQVLPQIATYGTTAAGGILALGGAMLAFGAGAVVAGAGLLVLTAGLLGLTLGLTALVVGFTVASAGVAVFAGAMKLVQTTIKGIAKSAKAAGKSITEMVTGVNVIQTGLGTLGSTAKGALDSLKSAVQSLGTSLPSSAQTAMSGMNSALSSGFNTAQANASSAASGIVARLMTASAGAFSAGAMIGMGLANGMSSQLGRVQAIAASLASAANKAIAAKAKIGSPSKITTYFGKMEGLGLINGMKSMKSGIVKTANKVFAVARPNNRYNMPQTDNDAFYGVDPEITTILAIDGRKFAKATSRNIRNQTSIDQRRENRKVGVV